MADSNGKSSDRPQYCRDATWYPLRAGWQPSHIPNQSFGLPPLPPPADLSWMESVYRRLAALSWPGYVWCAQPCTPMYPKLQRDFWARGAEVKGEPYKWRVSLDVFHFFPAELSVRTTEDGFLEIRGKHEERQDEHGFISRSFTRRYKLPIGIDAQTIRTSLSADGILIVEASLPAIPKPQMVIPVQLERDAKKREEPRTENTIEREQKRETEGQDPQLNDRKPSPTSPTRPPVWVPKAEDYQYGQPGEQGSSEFSSGSSASQTRFSDAHLQARENSGDVHAHEEEGARQETQDQFTDQPETPATPDTLTSEQEEASSDMSHDREAQQQQDHHQRHQDQDGEQRDESHEEGDLHREGSGEETPRGQEQESSQLQQEFVVPEQEVLEGDMPQ